MRSLECDGVRNTEPGAEVSLGNVGVELILDTGKDKRRKWPKIKTPGAQALCYNAPFSQRVTDSP
jgi:hypothetical protein